jgi:hypothetical protein
MLYGTDGGDGSLLFTITRRGGRQRRTLTPRPISCSPRQARGADDFHFKVSCDDFEPLRRDQDPERQRACRASQQ